MLRVIIPARKGLLDVHDGLQEDLGRPGHSGKAAVENLGDDASQALR